MILELVPLNEDAQDLLQDTDLTGIDLNDGLPILLDQAQSKGYLESGDTVFFAVGLAHLIAEDGLVFTLRDAGYTVELVTFDLQK